MPGTGLVLGAALMGLSLTFWMGTCMSRGVLTSGSPLLI